MRLICLRTDHTRKGFNMRINFCTEPKPYWVLGVWASELQRRMPGSTITSMTPDSYADVNVYINYALYQKTAGLDLCVFTHRERAQEHADIFDSVARECDWCFAQSNPTLELLPENKRSILPIGINEAYYKPIRIGVSGRDYNSGRKRYHLIDTVKAIGGVEVVHADGNTPRDKMPEFYKSLDYLLITAHNEGGPMPVVEALACGTPVIAPKDVGWCNDYSCIFYDGSESDLRRVINGLVIKQDRWDRAVDEIDRVIQLL